MHTLTRALLAILTTVGGLALTTPPARALSCVGPEGVIGGAATVFTGHVVDSEDEPGFDTGGRILVEVDEVWKGDVAERAWLETELDGWWDMMPTGTIPEGFVSQKTWLFAPRATRSGDTVSPCSAWDTTEPWGTKLRPDVVTLPDASTESTETRSAAEPAPVPDADRSSAGLIVGVGTGAALVVLGATVAWRRRRTD